MFVYSGLQGNSLQKTISKLLYGSLTCTRSDFSSWHRGHPVKAPIRRTHTYLVPSLRMIRRACSDTIPKTFLQQGRTINSSL